MRWQAAGHGASWWDTALFFALLVATSQMHRSGALITIVVVGIIGGSMFWHTFVDCFAAKPSECMMGVGEAVQSVSISHRIA